VPEQPGLSENNPLFGSSVALNYHSLNFIRLRGPVDMARQLDGSDA
jgi:hypothetical protein